MMLLITIWPATILLIFVLSLWEMYQRHQAEKIYSVLRDRGYNSLNEAIPNLSIKELKLLFKAEKIGAIILSPDHRQLVQRHLVDKSFEKTILGETDGKRKDEKEKSR